MKRLDFFLSDTQKKSNYQRLKVMQYHPVTNINANFFKSKVYII